MVRKTRVDLGIPYTGWPVRAENDYEFGLRELESEIVEAVRVWAADFNREFDEVTGWSCRESRQDHQAEGYRLQRRIQEALGDAYEVILDPLGSGAVSPEDVQ